MLRCRSSAWSQRPWSAALLDDVEYLQSCLEDEADMAGRVEAGTHGYCSPCHRMPFMAGRMDGCSSRHRMQFKSRNEGQKCV